MCDLTAGKCDANCCCDAECSEIELARFAELGACLDEGPADEVTNRCYSTGGCTRPTSIPSVMCTMFDCIELLPLFWSLVGSIGRDVHVQILRRLSPDRLICHLWTYLRVSTDTPNWFPIHPAIYYSKASVFNVSTGKDAHLFRGWTDMGC